MFNESIVSRLTFLILVVFIGCSNNNIEPVTPNDTSNNNLLPAVERHELNSNKALLGTWTALFDLDDLSVTISPSRLNQVHYNVIAYIPVPSIIVNSYNPANGIIDIDVTISNPFPVNVHDVRLIIFTDAIGHILLNHDNWTSLYDIPDGLPINPFKAYAKGQPNRIFQGSTQHTENLLVYLPGGNPYVEFAVDASIGGNCEEPYEIIDFDHSDLYSVPGSCSDADVYVYDWQDDVDSVNLYCPEVTGPGYVEFSPAINDRWVADLINETGASAGNYPGFVIASSSNSGLLALYHHVELVVSYTDGNIPPCCYIDVSPDPPYTPGQELFFDAARSYDPDGAIVLYEWDFDFEGEFNVEETGPTPPTKIYHGVCFVVLRVTDDGNPPRECLKGIEIH